MPVFRPAALLLILCLLPLAAAGGSGQQEKDAAQDRQARGVPWYGQMEYGDAPLGDSRRITIRTHGCALASSAMVLSYFGVDTDPKKLNARLLEAGAFDKGWDDDTGEYLGRVRIIWDQAAAAFPAVRSFLRRDFRNEKADLKLIRSYLDKNIPVIAEVLRPGGIPHFVVIYAYGGDEFLIRDPLDPETVKLSDSYNISDAAGSGAARNIYGIRVFIPDPKRPGRE